MLWPYGHCDSTHLENIWEILLSITDAQPSAGPGQLKTATSQTFSYIYCVSKQLEVSAALKKLLSRPRVVLAAASHCLPSSTNAVSHRSQVVLA